MSESNRQLLAECQRRHEERKARREAIAADCRARFTRIRSHLNRARAIFQAEFNAMTEALRRGEVQS
jgi:hypothetical protein